MNKRNFVIITSLLLICLFLTIIFNIKILSIFLLISLILISFLFYKNWIEHSVELGKSELPAVILDETGKVIYQNNAHRKFFGYKDEIIGKRDYSLPDHILNSILEKRETGTELWVKIKNSKKETVDTLLIYFYKRGKYIIFKIPIGTKNSLYSKFMEAEKLAVIGSIASGLAHQLNTPLGTMLLTSQMIKDEIKDKEIRGEIDTIEEQIRFCQGIVKKLLFLSKPSEEESSEFNINEVIREVAKIFEKTFQKKNIKFKLLTSNETDALIYGKRNEIAQIFMNLFSNSIDAMEDGGEIKVTSFVTPFERIIVKVSDTGKGIDPEYTERIFEPFFTTKPTSKGTGLGLSIVKRIVESHGGTIKLLNEGKGATFLIIFPVSKNE